MSAVLATFTSRCGLCDESIHEGQPIVCVDDEWVHEECLEVEVEVIESYAAISDVARPKEER